MSWLDTPVSLFSCMADNIGETKTLREILLNQVDVEHQYFYQSPQSVNPTKPTWISGKAVDQDTISQLRDPAITPDQRKHLKSMLQCYTPSAQLTSKKKGEVQVVSRSPILQLDFDFKDIHQYDLEELKDTVFSLPFTACCSLSCSGTGFFALILIGEPDKLEQYAEHCFTVFENQGIKPDTSKGRNVNDLRLVSCDDRLLTREHPVPLIVEGLKAQPARQTQQPSKRTSTTKTSVSRMVSNGMDQLQKAEKGTRTTTVQRVCYFLGGLGQPTLLKQIETIISSTSIYEDDQDAFIRCAKQCFEDGGHKQLNSRSP